MKKLFVFILTLLCVPIMVNASEYNYVPMGLEESLKAEGISYDLGNYTTNKNKVNVYLFRGQGCTHCKHFLEFVSNTLVKEYGDYFNFVSYEVWKNSDNAHLRDEVRKKFNLESKGVPLIVINDKFFSGYGVSRNEAIINLIKSEYENPDRVDIVSEIINGDSSNQSNNFENQDSNESTSNSIIHHETIYGDFDDNDNNRTQTSSNESNDEIDIKLVAGIVSFVVLIIVLVFVILTYFKIKKK